MGTAKDLQGMLIPLWDTVSYAEVASSKNMNAALSSWRACRCTDATHSIGHSQLPLGMKPKELAGNRPYSWHTTISLVPTALSTILNMTSRQVTGRAPFKSFGSGTMSPLIWFAFITGNSSLEPLIEGLCAQIHVNLRWRVFGRNISLIILGASPAKMRLVMARIGMSCSSDISRISSTVVSLPDFLILHAFAWWRNSVTSANGWNILRKLQMVGISFGSSRLRVDTGGGQCRNPPPYWQRECSTSAGSGWIPCESEIFKILSLWLPPQCHAARSRTYLEVWLPVSNMVVQFLMFPNVCSVLVMLSTYA